MARLGALAFGIGATEVAHVLATQTLWQRKPKTMRITVDGQLGPRRDGEGRDPRDHRPDRRGGRHRARHRISRAAAIRGLSMEGRLTRLQHVDRGRRPRRHGRAGRDDLRLPARPALRAEGRGMGRGGRGLARACSSDPGAAFDREVMLDAGDISPMVTWGTSPEDATADHGGASPIRRTSPTPTGASAMRRALAYMGLAPGTALDDVARRPCLHRLVHQRPHRGPAQRRRGGQGPQGGRRRRSLGRAGLASRSSAQAEAEGLDRIFRAAGFEWREPGCSMCLGTNGDIVRAGRALRLHLEPQLRRAGRGRARARI